MRNEQVVVLTGSLQDQAFPIQGQLSIGRNPDNGLQLDDLQVSRRHAVIEQADTGTILRDLGSGNGTFIGERRILEYKLCPGDIIQIGAQQLRFESGGAPPAAVPATEEAAEARPGDTMVRFETPPQENFEASDAANLYETFFRVSETAKTDEQLLETQRRLQAVYAANEIIASERNLRKLFERVMDQIFALVPAHNGVILLFDSETGELLTEYVKTGVENAEVSISSTIVSRAVEHGEAVITCDAADDSRFEAGVSIIRQNISSAMCVPLAHQDERLGAIYVDTRGTTNAFVAGDLELLVAVAAPAGVAIQNARYLEMLEQAYQDTLIALANAIELRDHYTVGHTWRVTNFSVEIARELGWSEEALKEVQMGGVLHDVGKIAVDDAILGKPEHLTEHEYAKMKVHPERGADLLRDVAFLRSLIPYCLYHHERFDGGGYPFGLSGEAIPIQGRLMAVADTFDAMTSNRPYRKGLDPEVSIQEIRKGSGTQFDPECVDALERSYRAGKIDRILQDYYKKEAHSIACPFCSTFIRLSDDAEAGDTVECGVCHRTIRVLEKNNIFYGEYIPQSGTNSVRTTPRPGADPE